MSTPGRVTLRRPARSIENKHHHLRTLKPDADNITIRNSVVNLTNTDQRRQWYSAMANEQER